MMSMDAAVNKLASARMTTAAPVLGRPMGSDRRRWLFR
jgi:hypothetical protein